MGWELLVLIPATHTSTVKAEVGLEAVVDKDETHPQMLRGPSPNTKATATDRPGPAQHPAVQPQGASSESLALYIHPSSISPASKVILIVSYP